MAAIYIFLAAVILASIIRGRYYLRKAELEILHAYKEKYRRHSRVFYNLARNVTIGLVLLLILVELLL